MRMIAPSSVIPPVLLATLKAWNWLTETCTHPAFRFRTWSPWQGKILSSATCLILTLSSSASRTLEILKAARLDSTKVIPSSSQKISQFSSQPCSPQYPDFGTESTPRSRATLMDLVAARAGSLKPHLPPKWQTLKPLEKLLTDVTMLLSSKRLRLSLEEMSNVASQHLLLSIPKLSLPSK